MENLNKRLQSTTEKCDTVNNSSLTVQSSGATVNSTHESSTSTSANSSISFDHSVGLTRTELSTALEIQIPLVLNAHGIKCTSKAHRNKPCNCTLVQNEMLLFKEYNGTKV
ncbi:unnamed protein product [Thelazia callipaeda]|uniref:Uncharacterized protein n=1 Tax=Thelazia callipaeda TaxID=103827 RepID=A0A0N5DBV5_THECL|nr:unnamed protein product [Thelazia callipaeda]